MIINLISNSECEAKVFSALIWKISGEQMDAAEEEGKLLMGAFFYTPW